MAHARLAPSAAKRWINCPASVALIEKLPPQRAGYAAAEGTVAHDLHERYHEGKLEYLEFVGLIGTTVMKDGHEVEITEEMLDSAIEYDAAIKSDIETLERLRKSPDGPQIVSLTEAKVEALSIDPECKGTADKLVYQKGSKLIVRDLKFGRTAVEADDNEQMSIYAVGAMDGPAGWAYDEVELIIDQPRAEHQDGRERRWLTTPKALKEFVVKARAAALETKNPNAQVKAGSWCRSSYCPVMSKCPAAQGMAQEHARSVFSEVVPTLLPEQMPSQEKRLTAYKEMRLPEVKLMSDTQLVDAKRWKEMVLGFFEAVDEHLEARMIAGENIAGVKLVDKRVNRKWRDEAEVVAKFGDKAYEKKLLSPSKMEGVMGKKAGVDDMTYKPEPGKIVVLSTDARPAAKGRAQDAFGVLPVRHENGVPVGIEQTPCPVCDMMGEPCNDHKPGAVAAAPEGREPFWPQ